MLIIFINKMQTKWQNMPLGIKVSTAYAVCSILQRCLSFITLPLFTRLLTTEQYGQLTIYSSWQGFLSIFLTLNLAYGTFSTAMIKFENDRDGYIASVEGICVFLSGIFLLIYLPLREFWNYWFQLPTRLILLMIVELLCSTSILFWSGKKRFEFKYVGVIAVTLLDSIISPIVAYFLVINSADKGYARIIGFAIVHICIGGAFFIFNAIRGKKLFDRTYWRYAFGFNIPLLAYYLSQVVFNQSDRIMISHMVGTDKAAIYGVAYSLAIVLTFVLNAINNSYVPWLYVKIKEKNLSANQKVSLGIAGFMAVILSGVIWLAPEVILIMAGKQYAEAMYVVPPVAISLLLLFYAQLSGNILFYFEKKDGLIKPSIYAAFINLILNWLFIRKFGYLAAAFTTLLSFAVFAFMLHVSAEYTLKENDITESVYDYKSLVILFAVFCGLSVVGAMLYDKMYIRLLVVMSLFVVLIIKRKAFLSFYKSAKNS